MLGVADQFLVCHVDPIIQRLERDLTQERLTAVRQCHDFDVAGAAANFNAGSRVNSNDNLAGYRAGRPIAIEWQPELTDHRFRQAEEDRIAASSANPARIELQ